MVLSCAVRTSSFLRKFSHFQLVLSAGLVYHCINNWSLPASILILSPSKQKPQESQKNLEWKGLLAVSSPAPYLIMNFSCFKSWLLPLASSLSLSEQSPVLSCLYPPSGCICICCMTISLFSGVNNPLSCTPVLYIPDLNTFPLERVWFNSSTEMRQKWYHRLYLAWLLPTLSLFRAMGAVTAPQ